MFLLRALARFRKQPICSSPALARALNKQVDDEGNDQRGGERSHYIQRPGPQGDQNQAGYDSCVESNPGQQFRVDRLD
jgi:hypothetical protein